MTTAIISNQTFKSPLIAGVMNFLSRDFSTKRSRKLLMNLIMPSIAILAFLGLWSVSAKNIVTSLGVFPGPTQVWEQALVLYQEHNEERDKEAEFYERMQVRIDKAIAAGKSPERIEKMRSRQYTGKETFLDQIFTSLLTVMVGFVIASIIAIPIGIVCGMSSTLYQAINPIIQIFKPVSPPPWSRWSACC